MAASRLCSARSLTCFHHPSLNKLAEGVAHKYLFYNELAIFRVGKTTTLKIAYYIIANDLRATPKKMNVKKLSTW